MSATDDQDTVTIDWPARPLDDDSVVARPAPVPPERESGVDGVQLYLREIGGRALLTMEQEVALAQRIERGKAAAAMLGQTGAVLDRDALNRLVADGVAARDDLVRANLRLVVSVARKYRCYRLSFLDLIQEGNIGLLHAIDKFDWRKGNRFSTYAVWWIRQSVSRALAEHGRSIRLPVRLAELLGQLRRATNQFEQTRHRAATPEDLAEALGISVRKVKRIMSVASTTVSLDQPVGPEGDLSIGETLSNARVDDPQEMILPNLLYHEVYAALEALSQRDRELLVLRFGLCDGRRRTLEEVGAVFGITRERARQIETDAMRRLRTLDVGRRLEEYLR